MKEKEVRHTMIRSRLFPACALLAAVLFASSVAWSQGPVGPITTTGPITILNNRPLILPTLEGFPGTVHFVKLGGDTDNDIFVSLLEAQPGVDETYPSRSVVLSARHTTAANPVAHVSIFLSGRHWNGTTDVPKAIELENKVNWKTGIPEFWLEEVVLAGGFPFMRMWRSEVSNGHIATHDQPAATLSLDAFDTNDRVYRKFVHAIAGNTPALQITPPPGGTVRLQGVHVSNDGAVGITKTCAGQPGSIVVRNGLIVSMVCP